MAHGTRWYVGDARGSYLKQVHGYSVLCFGRLGERYVTPGWDESAGLKNASASDETESEPHTWGDAQRVAVAIKLRRKLLIGRGSAGHRFGSVRKSGNDLWKIQMGSSGLSGTRRREWRE